MATGTSPMADIHIERDVDPSSPTLRTIPLANPNSIGETRPIPIQQQSRLAERAQVVQADGLMPRLGDDDNNEGIFEADDEDYVAVDHQDAAGCPWYFRQPSLLRQSPLDALHPFVQILSTSDVEDCVRVEASFPEPERCTKEKILYRLTKCPELSLGVFSRPPMVSDQYFPPAQLVAHILATRTTSMVVTEASMGMPENWQDRASTLPNGSGAEPLGHQDQGSTIVVHSLAVHSEHQRKGLGKTLMKAYVQRIKDAKIADRIALIAHDHLIPFYTNLGFKNTGPSDCTIGGGGWYNMVFEF